MLLAGCQLEDRQLVGAPPPGPSPMTTESAPLEAEAYEPCDELCAATEVISAWNRHDAAALTRFVNPRFGGAFLIWQLGLHVRAEWHSSMAALLATDTGRDQHQVTLEQPVAGPIPRYDGCHLLDDAALAVLAKYRFAPGVVRRVNGDAIELDSAADAARAKRFRTQVTDYFWDADADLGLFLVHERHAHRMWIFAVEQVEPCS